MDVLRVLFTARKRYRLKVRDPFKNLCKMKDKSEVVLLEKAQGSCISENVRPREARHWCFKNLLPNYRNSKRRPRYFKDEKDRPVRKRVFFVLFCFFFFTNFVDNN